ncbi:MAG TPA: addiction module antidote protein [Steroidobacteraceae bacterium]|jgi:probable addiction module antidote protein|nr:addiction module antidote protein [Steroidobacteraceae bacterium]
MKSQKARRKSRAKAKGTVKRIELAPFDAADYLRDGDVVAEYLAAALENPNPDVFLAAVADVAKARGISTVAKQSGMTRAGIYRGLSAGATPSFNTVMKITRALGVKLVPQKAA